MISKFTRGSAYSEEVLARTKKQMIAEAKELGNVAAVARKHGISNVTIHNWIKKSDQIESKISSRRSDRLKLKKLEQELADQKLENEILKELLKNKCCLA